MSTCLNERQNHFITKELVGEATKTCLEGQDKNGV